MRLVRELLRLAREVRKLTDGGLSLSQAVPSLVAEVERLGQTGICLPSARGCHKLGPEPRQVALAAGTRAQH